MSFQSSYWSGLRLSQYADSSCLQFLSFFRGDSTHPDLCVVMVVPRERIPFSTGLSFLDIILLLVLIRKPSLPVGGNQWPMRHEGGMGTVGKQTMCIVKILCKSSDRVWL